MLEAVMLEAVAVLAAVNRISNESVVLMDV